MGVGKRPVAVRWGCVEHRTPAGQVCDWCTAQGELFARAEARPGRRRTRPADPTEPGR